MPSFDIHERPSQDQNQKSETAAAGLRRRDESRTKKEINDCQKRRTTFRAIQLGGPLITSKVALECFQIT